jgi:hypothetical protein
VGIGCGGQWFFGEEETDNCESKNKQQQRQKADPYGMTTKETNKDES